MYVVISVETIITIISVKAMVIIIYLSKMSVSKPVEYICENTQNEIKLKQGQYDCSVIKPEEYQYQVNSVYINGSKEYSFVASL